MVITFFNRKGGTGKTSISSSIAKDLDYFLISNDDSTIEKLYPDRAKIIPDVADVHEGYDVVYDLGGYLAKGTETILKKSDLVVIPLLVDANSVTVTLNIIQSIQKFNKNIIVILNQLSKKRVKKNKKEIKEIETLLKVKSIPCFRLAETEALFEISFTGVSLKEAYESSALSRHAYRNVYQEYTTILERIQAWKA